MVMQDSALYWRKLLHYVFFPHSLHKFIHHIIDRLFLLYSLDVRDLGSYTFFFFLFFLFKGKLFLSK